MAKAKKANQQKARTKADEKTKSIQLAVDAYVHPDTDLLT
jgi:hypothetical protein